MQLPQVDQAAISVPCPALPDRPIQTWDDMRDYLLLVMKLYGECAARHNSGYTAAPE